MKGGKLIYNGSKVCVFTPEIPCGNKNKKNKKNKKTKGKKKKKSMVGGGKHTKRKQLTIKKMNPDKCCRCAYIKKNGKLFKIRGQWPHCSYDMDNCCKDKKTIIHQTNKLKRKKDAEFKNILDSIKDKSSKQSRRLTRSGNRKDKNTIVKYKK